MEYTVARFLIEQRACPLDDYDDKDVVYVYIWVTTAAMVD